MPAPDDRAAPRSTGAQIFLLILAAVAVSGLGYALWRTVSDPADRADHLLLAASFAIQVGLLIYYLVRARRGARRPS